ncbi:transforming growth factor beta activator LRRC33-like [Megalops cyprinoides]|uniref:transforming growth factor beta activator LRRC33-like n=1 Tax=Megalops cyprinoides TaxID=118141 RepID=UPI0018652502|nr:transforming growth factor beta activator LRRC33-like [Megalops cyprinoides]
MPLRVFLPYLACLAVGLPWDILTPAASHSEYAHQGHCQLTQRTALCDGSQLSSVPADLPGDIEELNLNCNHIGMLKNTCLSGYPHLRVLSCASCHLDGIESNVFHNTLYLENLNLAENDLCSRYQSTGQALRLLSQLKALDLSQNGLTEDMVSFILRNMSSLEYLSLSGNVLLRLDQAIFSDLHQLEELHLERNALYEIEEGALDGLHKLRRLNLAFNGLPCLVNFRLTQLKVLNASHNNIEWFISDQGMDEPFHLETLDLQDNKLLFFPFLPTRSRVRSLLLSNNKVSFYQHLADRRSPNWTTSVQFFNLNGNHSNVTADLWDEALHGDISSVDLLDLTGNQVSYLPQGFLSKMPKLSRLRLGRNCLESFGFSSEELSASLYELDMSNNRITVLHANESCLTTLGNLTHLNLSLNDLQRFPSRMFTALPSLTTLDLSYSKVDICFSEKLDRGAQPHDCVVWTNVSSLRQLFLRGCNLGRIPPYAFGGTPLIHLDLSDNPGIVLGCDSLAGLSETLQHLSLGNTGIKDFDFTPFIHLRSLDLSRNSISHVPGSLTSPGLRWLDLRNNDLNTIPFHQAKTLSTTLQTLFIGGNPFNCCELEWYRVLEGGSSVNIADRSDVTCQHVTRGRQSVERMSGHPCRNGRDESGWWYVALFLPLCLSFVGIIVIFVLTFKSTQVPKVIKKRYLRTTTY